MTPPSGVTNWTLQHKLYTQMCENGINITCTVDWCISNIHHLINTIIGGLRFAKYNTIC